MNRFGKTLDSLECVSHHELSFSVIMLFNILDRSFLDD